MRRDLTGKRVILTGATGGIGQATAAALVRAGARLVIAARSEDTLSDLAEDLRVPGNAVQAPSAGRRGAAFEATPQPRHRPVPEQH